MNNTTEEIIRRDNKDPCRVSLSCGIAYGQGSVRCTNSDIQPHGSSWGQGYGFSPGAGDLRNEGFGDTSSYDTVDIDLTDSYESGSAEGAGDSSYRGAG